MSVLSWKIESVVSLLEGIGCKAHPSGDSISIACPRIPFSQGRGHDYLSSGEDWRAKRPSMRIRVKVDEPCLYHCFACKVGGHGLDRLFYELVQHGVASPAQYEAATKLEEVEVESLFAKDPAKSVDPRGAKPKCGESLTADSFLPGQPIAVAYLKDRGICPDLTKAFGIGYDATRNRVTFPIFHPDGSYFGTTGRAVYSGAVAKYYNYDTDTVRDVVFGGQQLLAPIGIVLCEGPVSAMAAAQGLGRFKRTHVAVSSLGSKLQDGQADLLVASGLEVVLMYDNDPAGWVGTRWAVSKLSRRVRVRVVRWPWSAETDPAEVPQEIERLVADARVP